MLDYLAAPPDYTQTEVAEVLDEVSLWAARFGSLLLDHVPLEREATVLDVGCGTGFPLFELALRLGPGARVVGVDPWGAGLRRAGRKRRGYGLERVLLVEGDGARLPFGRGVFDLVVSNLGINNFVDPAGVLGECGRVARMGGALALTTNTVGHWSAFYEVYRETLVQLGLGAYMERLAAQEAHRMDQAQICGLVAGAGFEVVRVVEERFGMRFGDGSALLRHFLTRVGFLGGWRAVVAGADEATVFGQLEANLNAVAAARGGLVMEVPMLYVEGRRMGDG